MIVPNPPDEDRIAPETATALIIEDLLLLLFDAKSGVFRGEGTTLFNVLAGAAFVDLTLAENVELVDKGILHGKEVHAMTGNPPADPVLRDAWDRIAQHPYEVHTMVATVGPHLREPTVERLVRNGHLRREKRRFLGLFPTTALVDGDTPRRAELIAAVRAVLVEDAEPDARTAALAALLSASDTLPQFDREIPWSGAVYKNGKKLEHGSWGTAAAAEVVARAGAAAISATFVTNVLPAIRDN
ncbi:GPP34 family phosphoprotein [Cryobacterium lactosi]|uniref:GPP34 family phosphoprotein n=1 Tax=Cryobacterium lactosi TaxID=1259202 RepID=A0A4R9BW76_9MICO|nr:GPP34 family phosphoprotein [Cryobacterium lactosi]TFD92114.1 GPP34 family phosphoprotein [Cryobacterium lactosi]